MKKSIQFIVLALLVSGCSEEGKLFRNPGGGETGVLFENTVTPTEDLNILDYLYFYNGGGVALGDINNDGLPDLFFSGNQVKNKLYLNKGGLKFEDITEKSGTAGNSSWNTGAVMGDINGDGLLDIYVCAVVGINGFNGHNELYINKGNGVFSEESGAYRLDFETYSSSAAFLDFDLDGDLDIYLLNHAVHTQESFGRADLRLERNYQTGDKLLRNDGGKFTDISEEAGIYGGINGYGLGVAVSDFNQDGYPDIFVGNDFHEDDYYYLNNGDGTFTESMKKYFGQTTRFSMGNDVSDINHDGWPDIISLDMLPQDEKVLKSSEGDDNIQTQKLRTEQYGYHYQFTRNMLQLNNPGGAFAETALLSGIAATDWSWSALFGDFNQDGEQDLFISNGITRRPNDLDFINFVSDEQIKKKISNTKLVDKQALNMMPSGAVHNYIFEGSDSLVFRDMSHKWIINDTLISGATAMGDLDNDGDLDLVTNNSNGPATLYINKTGTHANYLKLKFKYKGANPFGIGTKVFSWHNGRLQYKELFTVRGFQSSSEPIIHFGYGSSTKADSLKIIWPDKTFQLLKSINTNQTLTLSPGATKPFDYASLLPPVNEVFRKVPGDLGIDFTHTEDNYIDFNRQKLIPYAFSDRGPATAVGDLNNDGKTDVYFGGSKFYPSRVFLQTDSIYREKMIPSIRKDSVKEDIAAVIKDFNGDGKNDLIVATGGADFYNRMKPLQDSYFSQNDTTFEPAALPEMYGNGSVIIASDYDQDGDLDLFIGNQMVTNDFGQIPKSYLLQNNEGAFSIVENAALEHVGMVTDAVWSDFDGDGMEDLVVVGEWISPQFFKNTDGKLTEVKVLDRVINGLWQSLVPFDIDGDGDMDYILGNWGSNTKFKASDKAPLRMYYADFDANGSTETIIAIRKDGEYYPIEGLGGLASQMESLRKKFTSYKDFAGKTIDQILDKSTLGKATVFEVNELRSGFLENREGHFTFVPFGLDMQLAPITALLVYDFDGDSEEEVLAAGNYFGVKPYHGRLGSFTGAMIKKKNNVILGHQTGLDIAHKSTRHLNIISQNNHPYLLVTLNNEKAQVYQLTKKNK